MSQENRPVWRSMLFVPAHVDKFVAAAHTRGADALILDLEDSVPPSHKAEARSQLAASARTVTQAGASALVRINADPTLWKDDLDAAIGPAVRALMLPKVEFARQVNEIDARVGELEQQRGLAQGHTLLIAQIEHVCSLPMMDAIATTSARLLGMILGSEDFSASAGMEPTRETLFGPNQQLVFACRRAGLLPFGFPGSISLFRDIDGFRELIRLARRMGFVGSYAIHPNQVAVMNQEFAPSAEEIAWARGLIEAWAVAQAAGRGAFEFQGRMVDPPVVARAQEVLRRAAGPRKQLSEKR